MATLAQHAQYTHSCAHDFWAAGLRGNQKNIYFFAFSKVSNFFHYFWSAGLRGASRSFAELQFSKKSLFFFEFLLRGAPRGFAGLRGASRGFAETKKTCFFAFVQHFPIFFHYFWAAGLREARSAPLTLHARWGTFSGLVGFAGTGGPCGDWRGLRGLHGGPCGD